MLRLLFRYALLPIIAIVLLCYAAIPLWVPILATALLKPYQWQDIELTVAYPTHDNWHIKQVSWRQEGGAGTYVTSLTDVSLNYTWQSIKARQWPQLDIGVAKSVIQTDPKHLSLIPSIALLPSQWLSAWPKFTVAKFNLNLAAQGEQFALSGQLRNQTEGLSILSKISTPLQQQLYLDATLGIDDQVEAKLFATQNSAPVAKLTSGMKRQSTGYVWQGQGAVNLAYTQKLLIDLLPLDLVQTTINQGKLNSHWKITLPTGAGKDNYVNFESWLSQAQGQLQSQIQMAASNPNVKELYVDASLTQTLEPNNAPQWRINEGSMVRVSPAWNHTKIDPNLYQSLRLEQAQLTFSAASPVVIESLKKTDLMGSKTGLRLHGDINATLENTHSVYQVFGQLSQLQVHALNHWQGVANLSGYYLAQTDANPWMAQLPIDLRQLQFLSNVAFDFDPKQWQFKVQPNSKISATQVVSRREAGTVQLFASDKLNLTNDQGINLAYLPDQDYWTWSKASVYLRPESIPSQGLEIHLGEGSTLLTNRPIEGSFELRPTSVNLPNWPAFQALSKGQLSWLDGQLNVNFTSQLPPYISSLNGQYTWHADNADHQLLVKVEKVNLPPLMPQLKQLENASGLPAPLLVNVTSGLANYEADWRWNSKQLVAIQKINYSKVDARSTHLNIKGLTGQSEFNYSRNRSKDKQSGIINGTTSGQHQVKANYVSWAPDKGKSLLNSEVTFSTEGWSGMRYQIERINAGWLGGRAVGTAVSILTERLNTLPITLQDIPLGRLVELAKIPSLTATGEVSGGVNITIDLTPGSHQTWGVANANLSTSKVGTIQYKGNDDPDTSDKAAYLQEILSEFEFQNLSAKLTHNDDNELQLLTRFVGSNKQFEEGNKVDFSLTLNPQLD